PLAALDRRIVEDAHRGDVDDEPGTRRIRQDELRRNHDLAAFPGEPWVDLRIGAQELLVADVEAPRDVAQRIVLRGSHHLHHPDDVLTGLELEALVGERQRFLGAPGETGAAGAAAGWRSAPRSEHPAIRQLSAAVAVRTPANLMAE